MDLKVGDVVRLRSGGPEMTVNQYPFKTIDGREHPNLVECKWFTEEARIKRQTFNIDALEKI